MTQAGTAFIDVDGHFEGFNAGVRRSVGDAGGSFKSAFKGITAAVGGVFAVREVADFFKSSVDEAREAAKVGALTEQVIKSTGGAAKVSAGQIGDLATAISNKSGIDDEAIQSGENLLLTFTDIRNEAGKGNDIFNQSTQAVTDISVALGQDLKSSAIQVGKALNDPVKGVTALSRVGVSFTEQQKEQIKTLVKSGDTLGAQKVILAELNKEFGGAAAAAASPLDKLGVTVGNLKEKIGDALLPTINRVADFLAANLPAALDFAGRAFGPLTGFVESLAGQFGPLIAQVSSGEGVFGSIGNLLRTVGDIIGTVFVPRINEFVAAFRERVIPAIVNTVQLVGDYLRPKIDDLRAAFERNRPQIEAVAKFLEQLGAKIAEVVLPTVAALGGFIGGLFIDYLSNAIDQIGYFVRIIEKIVDVAKKAKSAIGGVFSGVGGVLGNIPGFATGGFIAPGQLALVGERGPEYIAAGRQGNSVLNASATAAALGSGGGVNVTVNPSPGMDEVALGRHAAEAIAWQRKTGPR